MLKEPLDANIPEWHCAILDERMEEYKNNRESFEDFDTAIRDIEIVLQ